MPIWSEILAELGQTQKQGTPPDYDGVRRKYLLGLHQHTKRNVILYASGWLQKEEAPPTLVSISDEDIQAFMEVTHGLGGGKLDLILHSPGGSPEATEAVVSYLRSRFSHIRVIMPQLAISIVRLADDQRLQDLSLSVFHATTHTFTGTPAVKIVENHTGRAFIKQHV